MIIADTDVLVDYLRGGGLADRVALELTTPSFATTIITVFELLQGVKDAPAERAVRALLSAMTVLPLSVPAAERAAQLRRDLRKRREDIGVADSLVAGICLTNGGMLLTRNRAHFERVPELALSLGAK